MNVLRIFVAQWRTVQLNTSRRFWVQNLIYDLPVRRPFFCPKDLLSPVIKNACVTLFFQWASLTKLWICSELTQLCGAASALPKRGVNAEVTFDSKFVCNGHLSGSSHLRGKWANPIGLQCRPHTVPDRTSITGPLRCPGRVRQWAQYHSLHRQQRPGVRHKY